MYQNNINPLQASFDTIKQFISSANSIVVSSHINPDGDAIGSELALYHYLKKLDKSVEIINHSSTPGNLVFLEVAGEIKQYGDEFTIDYFNKADTIIIVDLNDPTRLKTLSEPLLTSKAKKIVIDHHEEPKQFADCYAVDTNASSTGEIICRMFFYWNATFDKKISNALYTAIMTDTGSFRFPRTTPEVHKIIAHLIECGADPVMCYEEVYNQMSYSKALLFGKAFSSLELFYRGKLGIIALRKSSFLDYGADESDTEDIVERILSVKGVEVGIMISEPPNSDSIRISFRSKGQYIVRDLALDFGGGGHLHAAGARAQNANIDDIRLELIAKAEKLFQ